MTQLRNIPSAIGVPGGAPNDIRSVAAYLTQLSVGLNSWIYQAATAINSLLSSGYVIADVPASSAVGIASGSVADIASIPLGAGDWDLEGVVVFVPAGTTTISALEDWVANASASPPALEFRNLLQVTAPAGAGQCLIAPRRRISLASAGKGYLSCFAVFGVSTMTAYGQIQARRA